MRNELHGLRNNTTSSLSSKELLFRQDGSMNLVLILVLLMQPLNVLLQCIVGYAIHKDKQKRGRMTTSCLVLFNMCICSMLFSVSAFLRTYSMPSLKGRAGMGEDIGKGIGYRKASDGLFFLSHNVLMSLHYIYLLFIILFGCELLLSAIYTTNRRAVLSIRTTLAVIVTIWCIGGLSAALLYNCKTCSPKNTLVYLLAALTVLTLVFTFTVYLRLYFLIKYKRKRIVTPGFNVQQLRETKLCLHVRFRMLSIVLVFYVLFMTIPAALFIFALKRVPKTMLFVYIPLVTMGNMAIGLTTVFCQKRTRRYVVKMLQCSKTDLGG